MDVLNFVVGLHEALQVDIPEADYPKYATLEDCVEQLAAITSAQPKAAPES
jgi:acyl carrier protein